MLEVMLKHTGIQRGLFKSEERAKEEANKLRAKIGYPRYSENYEKEEQRTHTVISDSGEMHIECASIASIGVYNVEQWEEMTDSFNGEANKQAKIEVAKKKALKEAGLE